MNVLSRILELISHGPRLTASADVAELGANEGHLLVHGVLARALNDRTLQSDSGALDDALRDAAAEPIREPAL